MCLSSMLFMLFFFFKQKTAYEMRISDWSSDVCSSDLPHLPARRIINLDALALGHQRFGQRGGIAAAGKFNEPAAGGADPRRIKRIDRDRGFDGDHETRPFGLDPLDPRRRDLEAGLAGKWIDIGEWLPYRTPAGR